MRIGEPSLLKLLQDPKQFRLLVLALLVIAGFLVNCMVLLADFLADSHNTDER